VADVAIPVPARPALAGSSAAVLTSTLMIAQQVAGKAVRDAVFLSVYRTKHLPYAMAAASVLSLVMVALWPQVTARVTPRRLMPALFAVSAALFASDLALFSITAHGGALFLYLQISALGPIVISTFWSFVDERFDPHTAKRAVSRIAGGGTLGGVLGGLAAWRAADHVSFRGAIAMLGAIHLACLLAALAIRPEDGSPSSGRERSRARTSSIGILREVPFLRHLAILVSAGAILSSFLDYVLGAQAVAHYGRDGSLLAFFSLFGLVVSVISLIIQVTLGRLAVEKIGLAVHIAVLPGVVVLGSTFGLAVPGLVSAAILRGAEMVHRNTLFRSAYELFYTPIGEAKKRAVKTLIDVGFDRAGTIAGSLATAVVVHLIVEAQSVLLGLVLVVAFLTFPVIRRLQAGYVLALEERLREGGDAPPISVDPDDPAREKLIVHAARVKGDAPRPFEAAADAALVARELADGDAERARAALERLTPETRAAAGFAVVLLGHPDLHRDARVALRGIASHITGQLVDAMLATDGHAVVRRRIPPILASAPGQRVAEGLVAALEDPAFEVRYAAGRALLRVAWAEPALSFARERIARIVIAEAKREEKVVASVVDDESLEGMEPIDIMMRDRVTRGLEHLFNVLSLMLERDALRLCFRALHQEDVRYRGTALEYLETVLPPAVREAIWPLLGETSGPLPSPRPAREVLEDLTKAIQLNER
jgi:ATP:ADP antiporter, AAA family